MGKNSRVVAQTAGDNAYREGGRTGWRWPCGPRLQKSGVSQKNPGVDLPSTATRFSEIHDQWTNGLMWEFGFENDSWGRDSPSSASLLRTLLLDSGLVCSKEATKARDSCISLIWGGSAASGHYIWSVGAIYPENCCFGETKRLRGRVRATRLHNMHRHRDAQHPFLVGETVVTCTPRPSCPTSSQDVSSSSRGELLEDTQVCG